MARPSGSVPGSCIQIVDTFAASDETIESVKAWLVGSGIDHSRIKLSNGRNWMKLNVTVEEAEALLQTEYNIFSHYATGEDRLGCEHYKVPQHLSEHIDFITPTVHFNAVVNPNKTKKRSESKMKSAYSNLKQATHPDAARTKSFSLSTCATAITPDCLRALYGFPNGSLDLLVTLNCFVGTFVSLQNIDHPTALWSSLPTHSFRLI